MSSSPPSLPSPPSGSTSSSGSTDDSPPTTPPSSPTVSSPIMDEDEDEDEEGEEIVHSFPRGKKSESGCCNILAFLCSCCGFSCYGDESDGFEWRCCGSVLCQEMCCCAICCCCCCISLNSWAFMIRSSFGVGVGGGGGRGDRSLGWSLQGIWGLNGQEKAKKQRQKLLIDSYGSYNTNS